VTVDDADVGIDDWGRPGGVPPCIRRRDATGSAVARILSMRSVPSFGLVVLKGVVIGG
jgi:hypothetical protein